MTLGGAGFASQRTTSSTHSWDLSAYDGIMLDIKSGDGKMYTFIIKDEILPPSEGGREQASISWEYDFRAENRGDEDEGSRGEEEKQVWIPWSKLKATYRGREKKDAAPIDLSHVRRFSLMMRSFFGTQEGDFSLVLRSISAAKNTDQKENEPGSIEAFSNPCHDDDGFDEKKRSLDQRREDNDQTETGLLSWLSAMCVVS
ncbi:MAG: hypothetical protein M1830_000430 [Pleopsidium flavum]|nr:MAG: hypothetical protein M1830_000430 [Pleopsidium flavum]